MQFETALNLIWLVLGALALANTLRVRRNRSGLHHAPAWLHVCGVAMIMAALFPYISATDDVLRIRHMDLQQTQGNRHEPAKKSSSDALIRLYEAMDTPVACTATEVSFTLFFVSLVLAPVSVLVDRSTPFRIGRSPPFAPLVPSSI